MTDFTHDVRLALRLLARRPAFAAISMLTLALGIGAPTAIFSVVQAVLLRPLPYAEPDRLVRFRMEVRGPAGGKASFDALPATTALEWQASSTTLAGISLFNDRALTLSTGEGPFRLTGISATPNLFDLMQATPLAGRTFSAETPDAREVVLSYATWQRYFSSSFSAVGQLATFDDELYRVVGVMPDDFRFPTAEAAFWVPLLIDRDGTRGMMLPAIGRIRPGSTLAAVLQEGRQVIDATRDGRREQTLLAETLLDQQVGGVRRVLWILLAAVIIVSVIATTNIALLLLTRGAGREREFSIRLALGAARRRLIGQLLVEAVTLAAIGGAVGMLVAAGALRMLVGLAPANMPRLQEASLNAEVLAFAMAVTATSSLIFGMLSAGRTIALESIPRLAGLSMQGLIAAQAPRRRLNVLAAGELALTMVLLVAAGLLLRSFIGLVLTPQGFEAGRALALQISLPSSRYPTSAARLAFHQRLLERLRESGQVTAAGLITTMPNRPPSARFAYDPTGARVPLEPMSPTIAEVRTASEGFFEAMGIPLLAGRTFRASDIEGGEAVMVISESMARLHFGHQNPIGRTLYSGTGDRTVIGVVGDVKPAADWVQHSPSAYLPLRQDEGILRWFASVTVVARGSDSAALASTLRSMVLSLDPEMPPFNVRTLGEEVSRLVAGPRFSAFVLAIFAGIALALAAIGVYGVMAYSAALRTREVGVRVALGATRAQVLGLMVRDGLVVVAAGLIAGLLAAMWLTQALTGMLHEVQPADPVALSSVAALLSTVGLLAVYVPARRATRINAVDALREE